MTMAEEYGIPGGDGHEVPGIPPLPCLNRVNSDGPLTGSQRKVAFALQENVRMMALRHGIHRLGFLTLTFKDDVQEIREAQRRFNNLCRRVISSRYLEWIVAVERQRSGRVHYHLLVACDWDVNAPAAGHKQFDFSAVRRGDYSSASERLKSEWAFWRGIPKRYPFGRSEMMPIRSNAEGIGKYLGKYIAKHLSSRRPEDKGARLVRYSQGTAKVSSRFSFDSPGAWLWRTKLKRLAVVCGIGSSAGFAKVLGPRWAYKMAVFVNAVRLPNYRDGRAFNADYPEALPVPPEVVDVECNQDEWQWLMAAVRCFWREVWRHGSYDVEQLHSYASSWQLY